MARLLLVTMTGLALSVPLVGSAKPDVTTLEQAAEEVTAADAVAAAEAIRRLRAAGPAGLAVLVERYRDSIDQHTQSTPAPDDPQWARLRTALDEVGAQRDCHASRLYWYTDLAAAQAAAREQGKPILSLRLLGKLTDEYSCANSRFFRTALYANRGVSDYLREHFVLHWQSVRPVPRVTIDFGDGRKLERTLTGNSIHYLLDASGRPVDALPGLYGPQAFLRHVQQVEAAIEQAEALTADGRKNFWRAWHRDRIRDIQIAWTRDLTQLKTTPASESRGISNISVVIGTVEPATATSAGTVEIPGVTPPVAPRTTAVVPNQSVNPPPPAAARAAEVAEPKRVLEAPLINAIALSPTESLIRNTTEEVWPRIAALHPEDVALDRASIALMAQQNFEPIAAMKLALTKSVTESPLMRMVRNFQNSMAIDTVRNEYELHRQIHEWFVAGAVQDLDALNERVYAELFLTPSSDPWLGLTTPDTYTALQQGGRGD